jgi:CheY-like chemotaxis protein
MPTILHVEDNIAYREGIRHVLEYAGYNVIPAENGAIALSLIQQKNCDLILSNNNMPEMTGIEFLQAVKADEQLKTIPFVMITGHSEESFAKNVRNLGADEIIVKPIKVDDLLSLLIKLLNRSASVG